MAATTARSASTPPRLADLASGGEILATAETLGEAGEVTISDEREATLRGVSAPVSVASIAWS